MPDAVSAVHVVASRLGPPRLFDGGAESGGSAFPWLFAAGVVVAVLTARFVAREVHRRMLGDDKLAYRLLSRRFGLGRNERSAVERLALREGVDPAGLLICESAFFRAATGEGAPRGTLVEAKPILLTGAEVNELGRVAERLFGAGAMDRLGHEPAHTEGGGSHGDDEHTSRWVA